MLWSFTSNWCGTKAESKLNNHEERLKTLEVKVEDHERRLQQGKPHPAGTDSSLPERLLQTCSVKSLRVVLPPNSSLRILAITILSLWEWIWASTITTRKRNAAVFNGIFR